MLEGIIIFAIGFTCGKYTDKVKDFCVNLYKKYFKKDEE